MNKILTVVAVTVIFSGCSSIQSVRVTDPAERHQIAKTEYYNNLNRQQIFNADELDSELDVTSIVAKVDPQ